MLLNANRMSTNLIVTVLVLVMVFLLPLLDRRICARLGVNLHHGVSSNPNADTLLEIRQLLLFGVFFVYLMVFAYLVFFSRSASEQYLVHIDPFADLHNAIDTDYGVFDFLVAIFKEGIQNAFSHAINSASILIATVLKICSSVQCGMEPYGKRILPHG